MFFSSARKPSYFFAKKIAINLSCFVFVIRFRFITQITDWTSLIRKVVKTVKHL